MNIWFFWTWNFSANVLKSLLKYDKDLNINIVISQVDKPIWRDRKLSYTPLKLVSLENNLKLLQFENLKWNNELIKALEWLDFIIVVAYGKILNKEILEIPKYWSINIHASILPKYRWASPIQEAIKNWDKKTWISIMYMNEKMDEGNILWIKEIDIADNDKTSDIFKKFEDISGDFLLEILHWIIAWNIVWKEQDSSQATYCSKIKKEDWEIDFLNKTALEIYNLFRAYSNWPWVFTYYKGKKLSIEDCYFDDFKIDFDSDFTIGDLVEYEYKWKNSIWILAKQGLLIINKIKLEWKKTIDIMSFINWNKDFLNYNFCKHV